MFSCISATDYRTAFFFFLTQHFILNLALSTCFLELISPFSSLCVLGSTVQDIGDEGVCVCTYICVCVHIYNQCSYICPWLQSPRLMVISSASSDLGNMHILGILSTLGILYFSPIKMLLPNGLFSSNILPIFLIFYWILVNLLSLKLFSSMSFFRELYS